MKTTLSRLLFLVTFLGIGLLSSCSSDDNDPPMPEEPDQTITELAQDTPDLSLLVDALVQADAGLVETLGSEGPFTVFAPTNEAFADLLDALGDSYNSLEDFDTAEEKELLAKVLTYHVVAGTAAFSTDLSDGQSITTVQGEALSVVLGSGTVAIDDATDTNANVVSADIAASNGVVHVIDKVLLPQEVIDALAGAPSQNIVELAQATPDLSLLVDALVQADAGLVETLGGEGPFTVFAPTNDAFAALLDALGDSYNSLEDFDTPEEKELLAKVLTYHVVAGTAAFSTDLSDGQSITTVQGEALSVILGEGTVAIGDATDTDAHVVSADIAATNGVVHVVDKVLLPQEVIDALAASPSQNIVELAQATPDLSLLVDALIQADAGLVETLGGEGPFTVFAPTNEAFAALLDALGDSYNSLEDFDTPEEKELLAKILTYHVNAGGAAFSTDLSDGQSITTVQGEALSVVLGAGTVAIGDATDTDANVVSADIAASNGVVHVVDKVLLPQEVIDALAASPSQNIVELAQATPDLSLLVDALVQADAGLVETLGGEGPFTVFAPTNEAFAHLLDALGASYNSLEDFDTPEEKELLAKILTYHVIAGTAAFSTDLTDGQSITTVQGEALSVILGSGTVAIGDATDTDANVVSADIAASNGVVHVVDKVLLPQEVVDAL